MNHLVLRTQHHLASSGTAVARHADGRVVFVQGAAPDELVEVEVTREKGRFLEGTVLRVREPSPSRVEPFCPVFGECGGCTTQHVSYEAQLESKARALSDALTRVAKLDLGATQIRTPWSGPPKAYRARARLAVAPDGTVGFRRAKSHGVVEVSECPVLVPALAAAFPVLPRHAERQIVEVEILAVGDQALVGDAEPVVFDDGYGPLYFGARSFTQSNPLGNLAILGDLDSMLGRSPIEDALELYAGHGNFTRVLARRAARVVAVEGDEGAVGLARRALPQVDHRAEPVEAAAAGLAGAGMRFDVALADPPRSGMSPSVLSALAQLTDRLFYVSCDVGTFARDAARLARLGLGLASVRLFDFYPQTPHAEVLGVFERV